MIILGTNSIKDTGYDVANSLRFNSGSSDYLNRTPSSAGNLRTMTFSFWMKRSKLTSGAQRIFSIFNNSGADQFWLRTADSSNDYIDFFSQTSSSQTLRLVSNARLRDVSAWYHIVIAVDTTQGTDSNRIKMYINGVQQTSFSTTSYPSQNTDLEWNKAIPNMLGAQQSNGTAEFIDMYLAEVCFIDGQQLAPTSFGEFDEDSGIWKPIDVSGLTFGTNGFYLDFENSSALGNDANGSNNFTVNNLTAIDQSTDTCTNNFATLNGVFNTPLTLAEGNLKATEGSNVWNYIQGTIAVASGKWYWECKCKGNYLVLGVIDQDEAKGYAVNDRNPFTSTDISTRSFGYYNIDGKYYSNGSGNTYGNTFASDDIIGVALDCDNKKLYFSKGGVFQNSGNPESGATGTGAISLNSNTSLFGMAIAVQNNNTEVNFGSPPYAISSGNADGNGYGNFEYAVPSGYFALNTKNLAEYG